MNKKYYKFVYILLIIGIFVRLNFIYVFKGMSDPWNSDSIYEYLVDGQVYMKVPRLPTEHVYTYINGMLVEAFGFTISFWIRVIGLVGDIGILFLLFKITKKMRKSEIFPLLVCAAYIFNPISFQLTVLHGKADQAVIFFILLAAYIELSSSWLRYQKTIAVASALLLAIYLQPWAILFFPAFLFKRDNVKEKKLFLLIYVLGIILPFAMLLDPYMVTRFVRNIMFYAGSKHDHLGWALLFDRVPVIGDIFNNYYVKIAMPLQICCAVVIGYIGRGKNILIVLFINTLAIYAVSPGLATQYLYWVIPIGVIFIDWVFCLYSVLGFMWQLNFFQYLIYTEKSYGNYHQFVPITSMDIFYNYWLYPEQFVRHAHFIVGGILIPALSVIWLIYLFKKYDFLVELTEN